jgi:hypothetical protein
MRQTSLHPSTAKLAGSRRQLSDGTVCIYCFETLNAAGSSDTHTAPIHRCEERMLAMQPAAPPPFH